MEGGPDASSHFVKAEAWFSELIVVELACLTPQHYRECFVVMLWLYVGLTAHIVEDLQLFV